MEKMNDLRDLLKHEIQDLVSAEDQIIEAMPAMIEKASDKKLKDSLRQHLKITQQQRKRLDQVQKSLTGEVENFREDSGLFSRLFKGKHHCKGMAGILDEGQKIMSEDIDPDVMDAAIIGAAQKVEHYEICGYGTARAYAEELGLRDVERLLMQTLNEEYEADVLLTELAVGRLNREAENAGNDNSGNGRKTSGLMRGSNGIGKTGSATKRQSSSRNSTASKKQNSSTARKSGSSASKSSGKSGASKKSASKSGSKAKSKATSKSRR
jgi:ferritin-like metal-binding protein YciE